MLKTIALSNLGTSGINTDIAPWDLPENYITDGINFRIANNYIFSTGSSSVWTIPPIGFNGGYLQNVSVPDGEFWVVCGRTAVYVYNGSNWSDISSGPYTAIPINGEVFWNGTQIGSVPVFNHPAIGPEYWSPQSGGQVLQALPFKPGAGGDWSDVDKSFSVIRAHKNFLFALDLIETGVRLPSSYRWSHPADNNAIPYTWDETDLSSIAGIAQLGSGGGRIVDGLTLRDSFCIYSETAIDLLTLSGDEFIFRRRTLSLTIGLLNQDCLVEIKGVHYFMGDGDIYKNDGTSITSIVHNRIRTRINSNINRDFYNRSFVRKNTILKEIWFCVPEGGSEYPNIAYVYNWTDDSWAIQELPDNIISMDYGTRSVTLETWGDEVGTWIEAGELPWGSSTRTILNKELIGLDASDGSLIFVDPLDSATNLDSSIERTDFALEGHKQVNTITRIYPYMQGSDDVTIQFGSKDHAGGPVRWDAVKTFNPSTDRKIDVRTTGELHNWRIKSVGVGSWSISGMLVEYSNSGDR